MTFRRHEGVSMPDITHPTLRVRRLGMHLRQLRESAGLTLEEASARMERSLSSLSKLETGRNVVRARDLRVILDLYGLEDDRLRETLFALLSDARKRGWWQEYGGVLSAASQDFLSLEADAGGMKVFETTLVPGLLQTEDYTRATVRADPLLPGREVEDRVAIRKARQSLLGKREQFKLWAIIAESVLWQQMGGPDVMRTQLRHLTEMARLDNVTLQVLPYSAGAHAGMDGSFAVLEFPEYDNWNIVYVGNLAGSVFLEQEGDIGRFNIVLDHLRASSLSLDDSLKMIERVAEAL
jgi:transcriptional regulator with XRE-family HTH domain